MNDLEKFLETVTDLVLEDEPINDIEDEFVSFFSYYSWLYGEQAIESFAKFCFDNNKETYLHQIIFDLIVLESTYDYSDFSELELDFSDTIFKNTLTVCYDRNKLDFIVKLVLDLMHKRSYFIENILSNFSNIYYSLGDLESIFKEEEYVKFVGRIISKIFSQDQHLINDIYFYFWENRIFNCNDVEKATKLMQLFFMVFEDEINNKILIDIMKPYSMIFLYEYLKNVLFCIDDDKLLLKVKRNLKFEEEMLKMFHKYGIIDYSIKKLDDIPVNFLVNKWAKFFNDEIKYKKIDGGYFSDVLMYILKDFGAGYTLGYLFENKKLENFYYIAEYNDTSKKLVELLKNKSKNTDNFFVIYTSCEEHAFIYVIANGFIEIIDSSLLHINDDGIFLNISRYQKNGTCYINAATAFKLILDLSNNNSIKDILEYIKDFKYFKQNIDFEVSRETLGLYELLASVKNSEFDVPESEQFLSSDSEQLPYYFTTPARIPFFYSNQKEGKTLSNSSTNVPLKHDSDLSFSVGRLFSPLPKEISFCPIEQKQNLPEPPRSEQFLLSAQADKIYTQVDQNKTNTLKQTRSLYRRAKRFMVKSNNFIIEEERLLEILNMSNYKIRYFSNTEDEECTADRIVVIKSKHNLEKMKQKYPRLYTRNIERKLGKDDHVIRLSKNGASL